MALNQNVQSFFSERETDNLHRLNELTSEMGALESLKNVPNLCVYTTGSFGRLEASRFSDLDLFFVQTGDKTSDSIGRIDKTLVDADIIRLTRKKGFPEFSRDGQFLEVHQLSDMLDNLGGPEDDSRNYFTARLLLLLESRPVYGQAVYDHVLKSLVQTYYRDYHDHVKDFRPVFLANDIVRYWKTLCLNYEHRRNRSSGDQSVRAKNHLKNFKLKFSRMLTCYSALAWIASKSIGPGPEDIVEMVALTPVQRLKAVRSLENVVEERVEQALEYYRWFLETVIRSEADLLGWVSERANRDDAFKRGRQFGQAMFELLLELSNGKPFLRYLVV